LLLNPFRYTSPLRSADELIDRDGEVDKLLTWAREGTNTRLVAPRRYGKTSLLKRALAEAEQVGGWITVYLDFFGVLTIADVTGRIDDAYAEHLTGTLAAWFQGLRRAMKPNLRVGVPGSLGAGVDLSHDISLLERLDLPSKVAARSGQRVLVVFDEFQQVLSVGDNIDAVIRSRIQHHDRVSYVFAGSQVGMLNDLFTDPQRAFYAQARPLDIGPLPAPDVAEYVDAAFEATGKHVGSALGLLLDVAAGHPQRTMFLAHHIWEATPEGATADETTFAAAYDLAMTEEKDAFSAVWNGFSLNERRVVARVADNSEKLYTRSSTLAIPRSSVSDTARVLVHNAVIVPDDVALSGYRLVDPLLAAWIRAGRRPD
jgi:hypothetical protein